MNFPLFLIPILSGLMAQALKPFLNDRWYANIQPVGRALPRYGGMPSAHTAFAASLLITVGVAEGWFSGSFAIATALFIVIIDDALRMRMFLGRYGMALHKLIRRLPQQAQKDYPYVEDRLGHKPAEVLVGGTLGIVITVIIFWLI